MSTLFHTLIDRVRVRGYWGPSHLVKNMQTLGQFFEPLYLQFPCTIAHEPFSVYMLHVVCGGVNLLWNKLNVSVDRW